MSSKKTDFHPIITDAPLTAEAREAVLREHLGSTTPSEGTIFIPDDSFYVRGSAKKQAGVMRDQLCAWLGIPARKIGLVFEGAGHDANDSSHYRIFIESSMLTNEFVAGAFLAHALVRYLIEDTNHIRLAAADQQAGLLDAASILLGLGIVISNGLLPRYPALEAAGIHRRLKNDLLGSVSSEQYHQQLRAYLKRYRVPEAAYTAVCTPWAAHRLGIKLPKRTSHAVYVAQHGITLTRCKVAGISTVCIVLCALSGFVLLQRPRPIDKQAQVNQDHVQMLGELTQLCRDTLAYDKQYTDTSDLMGEQVINAEKARCDSLNNQYQAALTHTDDTSLTQQ